MILSGNLEVPFLTFSGLKCTHCFPNPKPYFKWSLFRIVQIYTRRFTYIQRKMARELLNFNLLILSMISLASHPYWVLSNLIQKIYIFETDVYVIVLLSLLFTQELLPLKAIIYIIINYIQKVNVRIYYLYTWNFPTKIFHQMEPINIYWPFYSTHRLLKRQKPSYKFNADCWYNFIDIIKRKFTSTFQLWVATNPKSDAQVSVFW